MLYYSSLLRPPLSRRHPVGRLGHRAVEALATPREAKSNSNSGNHINMTTSTTTTTTTTTTNEQHYH